MPGFTTDATARAVRRHLRRHVPRPQWFAQGQRFLGLGNSYSRSPATVWHLVGVKALQDAGQARRLGEFEHARAMLSLAREATRKGARA